MHPDSSTPDGAALPLTLEPAGWVPLAAVLHDQNLIAQTVEGLLQRFALPATIPWWLIFPGRPIVATRQPTPGCIVGAEAGAAVLPLHLGREWAGYTFLLFGVSTPQVLPEHPILVNTPWGAHPIYRICMTVQYRGDPLEVEQVWLPGYPSEPKFRHQQSSLSTEIWQRAGRGRDLLVDFEQVLHRAGQKPLEDKPHHPWREKATRAEELQREHPEWSHRKIARTVGMLSREKTLDRWRKRLQKEV